jgi:hypothetical protein
MNEQDPWLEANEEYLAAALVWLRLRLVWLAGQDQPPITASPRSGSWFKLSERSPGGEGASTPVPKVSDRDLQQAAEAMAEAEACSPPPALLLLQQQFGLSDFERLILLLCAAIEFDPRIAQLCAQAQNDPNRPYPTFALALALFEEADREALSPESPLRHWQLIEINQPGAQPLITSPLRADERIVNYLKGLNYLDVRLTTLLAPLELPPTALAVSLPDSQQAARDAALGYLNGRSPQSRFPVIQLVGADSLSQQLIAQWVANDCQHQLYRLPVELLPSQASDLEIFARLWQRENLLWSSLGFPIALFLDTHAIDSPSGESQAVPLARFLSRSSGLFFVGTREVQRSLGCPSQVVDVDKPTPAEQQAMWQGAVTCIHPRSAELLAGQFNLNSLTLQGVVESLIRQLAQHASALDQGRQPGFTQAELAMEMQTGLSHLAEGYDSGPLWFWVIDRSLWALQVPLHQGLWDACLVSTRPRLESLAQRLEAKATWATLVLPEEETKLLHQIADQVRQRTTVYEDWGFHERMNRGLGISALFAGESGTGKTMAAEVIANELRLDLYRIDLSQVVSKYIGETEKNLRRLFDAAEDGGAILFFDEADALFGKRSEVKDSHDRYANIEINYLLQRIESYRGLAILATNMKTALDAAFMRRLRFIVTFPFPAVEQRQAIWEKVFPPKAEVQALNYQRLARLNLTGGSIHNIALNAAFLAAQARQRVTMEMVLEAARAEFRKLERPINEPDFRWAQPSTTVSRQPAAMKT